MPLYKKIYIILLCIMLISCANHKSQKQHQSQQGWKNIYAINKQGVVTTGNKNDLIKAVHMGCPIRVGWVGRTIEHVTDSHFLSVYKNEVFAQIIPIMRQAPDREIAEIKLDYLNNQKWYAIVGSDGSMHATMTDSKKEGNHKINSNWYINTNNCHL